MLIQRKCHSIIRDDSDLIGDWICSLPEKVTAEDLTTILNKIVKLVSLAITHLPFCYETETRGDFALGENLKIISGPLTSLIFKLNAKIYRACEV